MLLNNHNIYTSTVIKYSSDSNFGLWIRSPSKVKYDSAPRSLHKFFRALEQIIGAKHRYSFAALWSLISRMEYRVARIDLALYSTWPRGLRTKASMPREKNLAEEKDL
ncbi:Bgt-20336 [Blumeria graminis f. sp. tritici]|uniref:Bgt-20336 n=1 Tax=Blumeria graminis f. sp. tritici TaxID=62690 RepID=A0A9X9MEN6_BLUGR|nr:Bgt-20336 [Blumeria graminis f. sp. tritici]